MQKKAIEQKQWSLASKRWECIYNNPVSSNKLLIEAVLSLVRTCRHDARLGEAKRWLSEIVNRWPPAEIDSVKSDLDHEWMQLILFSYRWEKALENWQCARSSMLSCDWKSALNYWIKFIHHHLTGQVFIDAFFYKVECLGQLGEWDKLLAEFEVFKVPSLSKAEKEMLESWKLASQGQWTSAIELLQALTNSNVKPPYYYSALLFFSIEDENYSNAMYYLDHFIVEPEGELTSIVPHKNKKSFPEIIINTKRWLLESEEMTATEMYDFVKALRYYNYNVRAGTVSEKALKIYPNDEELRAESSVLLRSEEKLMID